MEKMSRVKVLLIAIIAIMIVGCGKYVSTDEKVSELKSPVILIGKDRQPGSYDSATFKDGNGKILSISGVSLASDMQCRNIGDTIK